MEEIKWADRIKNEVMLRRKVKKTSIMNAVMKKRRICLAILWEEMHCFCMPSKEKMVEKKLGSWKIEILDGLNNRRYYTYFKGAEEDRHHWKCQFCTGVQTYCYVELHTKYVIKPYIWIRSYVYTLSLMVHFRKLSFLVLHNPLIKCEWRSNPKGMTVV